MLNFQSYSLLIIDDNPTNLAVVVGFLEKAGFKVMIARNGKTGLKRANLVKPDLILLDVMMAGIDGFETCRRLKADETTASIPVIFMTSLTSTQDKVKGFELGAVDYVTKPIQEKEVLARITTHLNIYDLTLRLEKQNQSLQQVTAELEQANITLSEHADELAQRNQIISQAVEASGDAVLISQLDGQISYLNPTFSALFCYTKEELNQLGGVKAIFLSDAQASDLKNALQDALSWSDEMLLRAKDGSQRTTILRTNCIFDDSGDVVGYIYLMTDITPRKETEEQLRRSLKEKEVLLQEIHHRVKNNLQIISSLLYLQSQEIDDEPLLRLFKESQNRVKSMSLIHEQLYQREDLAQINFGDYTKRLITQLKRSYGATQIKFQVKVESPFSHQMLFLTIERAIPAGLIINELLSNAIKHAFLPTQRGEITVSMQATQERELIISVKDNGVGLPTALEPSQASSLGLTLVRTLVKQLKGTIEVKRPTQLTRDEEGTEFKMTFSDSIIFSER